MKLAELCSYLEGAQYPGPRDFDGEITGITCDSRKVVRGNLFIAVPGTHADGHGFINEAIGRGAAAVVTEKMVHLPENVPHILVPSSAIAVARLASGFYGEPSKKLSIVGITGTNGKTTTSYLLRSILRASGKKVGLIGSISYQVGDKLVGSTHTTPDAIALHRLFREMVDAGATHVVMEVSSHALAQHRTHGIEFRGAVFTNLTMDHLDYHLNLSNYREAKAKLFRDLSAEAFTVLNRDDNASMYFSLQTRARTFWYSLYDKSEVRIKLVDMRLSGMEVRLSSGREEVVVSTKLVGDHNIRNILAASTAALALGVSLADVKDGIELMTLVPGRLERVGAVDGYAVFVDYAHTPDALESVLIALRPLVENRLLLVFGCGGDRDRGKRPMMGRVGERFSDYMWVTSDNPRTENPASIAKDIEKGITGEAYRVELDRRSAIETAIHEAGKGDVVLIAGKGHEATQVFSDKVVSFDDREVVREVLLRRCRVSDTVVDGAASKKEEMPTGSSFV